MQSSVRSLTPRLVGDIGRQGSNTSIHIDQEISVVSSRRDSFKRNGQRATYSIIPSTNGHTREFSRGGTATVTASQPSRWNSESNPSRPSSMQRQQQSRDDILLESNKESMKALSDFLRTKEPPPDNFMSIPDSDTLSLHSIKKSAFKMFKRQKNEKSKRSRLLQLPDSAVSARTMGGNRHIAISIPLKHDYLFDQQSSQPATEIRPHSQPSKLPSERTAVVTVLKPVKELRESASSYSALANNDGKRDSTVSATTPAAELLGPETTRTLENYYLQLSSQQKENATLETTSGVKVGESSRPQRAYVAVSPLDQNPRDSHDPRHSGGTVYSTTSATSNQGHSRGVSSVSTAPSVITMKLELPPRTSSMSKIPRSLEAELAQSFAALNNVPPTPAQFGRTQSLTSGKSVSPPAMINVAETARSYNSVGIEHIRGPAPTRRLPDVPESPLVPSFMPRPSPTSSRENTPPVMLTPRQSQTRLSTTHSADPLQPVPQSRKDRVKARKTRDIAVLREKSPNPQPLSNISREPSLGNRPSTAPQNSKRKSTSHERLRRRKQNSVSAIMLVADIPPFTGTVLHSDLAYASPAEYKGVSSSGSNANISTKGTHTPPRSFVSSNFSDSDTTPKDDGSVGPGSLRSARSGLDSRRHERRMKRNISLRDKEFESRMRKIERDNAILMNTLGGIANSFVELNKVLPRSQQRRDMELLVSNEMEGVEMDESALSPRHRKMMSLEPIMRELQGTAGRVSGEESVGGVDDYEENDGTSIL